MDGQDHRVLLGSIEVRGLHDPALDVEVVGRFIPELLELAESDTRENVVVHVGELSNHSGLVQVEGHHVAGSVGAGARAHRDAAVGERSGHEQVLPLGHLPHLTIEAQEMQVSRASLVGGDVETRSVGGPSHPARDLPIEVTRDQTLIGTVPVHQIDAEVAVSVAVLVHAPVRNQVAVRGGLSTGVGTRASRELGDGL